MEKSARLRRAHGRANGISSKRTGICASEDLQPSVSFVERDTGMSMPSERSCVSSPKYKFSGVILVLSATVYNGLYPTECKHR